MLPSELAAPVSMALHELTMNTLRHGALVEPDGRLDVAWQVEDGSTGRSFWWDWSEHDGPLIATPPREEFGSLLLNKVLAAQAEVNVAFEVDGLRVSVRLPLPASGLTGIP